EDGPVRQERGQDEPDVRSPRQKRAPRPRYLSANARCRSLGGSMPAQATAFAFVLRSVLSRHRILTKWQAAIDKWQVVSCERSSGQAPNSKLEARYLSLATCHLPLRR